MPKRLSQKTSEDAAAAASAVGLAPIAFEGFPDPPDEQRLTVDGAILDAFGKLEVLAYISLKDHFMNEAPRDKHPVPVNPGTTEEDKEACKSKSLGWWCDPRGSGWKVQCKGQGKWFNVTKWGSWRLAFLLAKLQRDVWMKGEGETSTPRKSEASSSAASSASKKSKARTNQQEALESLGAAVDTSAEAHEEALESAGAAVDTSAEAHESEPAEASATPKRPRGRPKRQSPVTVAEPEVDAASPVAEAAELESAEVDEVEDEEASLKRRRQAEPAAAQAAVEAEQEEVLAAEEPMVLDPSPKKTPDQEDSSRPKLQERPRTGRSFAAALNTGASPSKRGRGSADDVVLIPSVHSSAARASAAFEGFPDEPDEPRLTVEGAITDEALKLVPSAYIDLKDHFADEAPRERHPVPAKPGVKLDEQNQLAGLRSWSDPKGEGWIAQGKHIVKWFNVRVWGSWRLAFVLARLQLAVWDRNPDAQAAPLRPRAQGKAKLRLKHRFKPGKAKKRDRVMAMQGQPVDALARRPKRLRKVRGPDADDETRLSQIAAGKSPRRVLTLATGKLPRKVRADMKMDPRSRMLQLRRQGKAGFESRSSFESIGDVVDEARSQSGLDIKVLAAASFDELEEAGGPSAFASEELLQLAEARAARTVRRATARALSSSASSSRALAATSETEADDARASSTADVDLPRGLDKVEPVSSAAFVSQDDFLLSHRSQFPTLEADSLSDEMEEPVGVKRIGPQAPEDVDAVIRELLKIGELY